MESQFAEQIVPGVFVRVLAEALIAPGGVSFGNVGIIGTAAALPPPDGDDDDDAAPAPPDPMGRVHILSSLEDARALFAPSDALSAATMNLMRGLEILFANGASTVYAYAVAVGANQDAYGTAADELIKEDINLLVAPELPTATATTVLKSKVDSAENAGRDLIAVIGADAATVTGDDSIASQVNADKRIVLCAPAIRAFDAAAGQTVTLPGQYTAAAVAGLIAALPPQVSPTNKTLSGVTELGRKFSYGELKSLLQADVLPLEDRRGIRVVRGITTEGAAFSQITTRRIVDYAKAGVRQVASPFVGRLNNERVRKALQGAIDSFLATMKVDEALVGYSVEVTASRQDEIAGRCVVNIGLQPTFSIDYIRVTLALS